MSAGPALAPRRLGASRAASASGAARAHPGPTTILPARPARGLAPSGRLESSPDTSRTTICGVGVAPRARVRRVRDQPRRGRDAFLSRRSVARRRARARLARVGLPLRDTDGIMTRCGRMRRIEAAFRKEGRTWAFVAARSPFRRAHARPRAPRWSRHGPRLGQNEVSRAWPHVQVSVGCSEVTTGRTSRRSGRASRGPGARPCCGRPSRRASRASSCSMATT